MTARTIQPGRRAAQTLLRAGVYGRESKDKTKSIDDQVRAGIDAVGDQGWHLEEVYTDGASASRFGRKVRRDWARLLTDLDAGSLDVVVVWEASRGDRDIERWVPFVCRCRDRGVLIYVTDGDETLDPRKPSQFRRLIEDGLDAYMETEKTSRRTRRGVATTAAAGGFHGDAPYGYLRAIIGERPTPNGPRPIKEQRPDPTTAPIVVNIFQRISRGDAVKTIVDDLNRDGVTPPGGGQLGWHRSTIRKIILNPAYIGKRVHDGQTYDATWPALVPVKLFRDAGKVLSSPNRRTAKTSRQRYLLSYIAKAPCGAGLGYAPERVGRPPVYHCITNGCASIGALEIDEFVTSTIVARFIKPDARRALVPLDDPTARDADEEAARLAQQLDEAVASWKTGGISITLLGQIEADLKPQIEAARKRARPSSVPSPIVDLIEAAEKANGDLSEAVRQAWDDLPVTAQRIIVTYVFEAVTVRPPDPARRLSRWSTPEQRYETAAGRVELPWRHPVAA